MARVWLERSGCDGIEAVFEDLKVKQEIFQEIERKAKPQAILASNTSSIPLQEIATVLNAPERLIGLHFFNPVSKMLLVEIVGSLQTPEQQQNAAAFINQLGHLPLPVSAAQVFWLTEF